MTAEHEAEGPAARRGFFVRAVSGEWINRTSIWIGLIALFWILSDLGYYVLLPAVGRVPDYNTDPVGISLYYLFWIGAALIVFWPLYESWGRHARSSVSHRRLLGLVLWVLTYGCAVGFVAFVMPNLSQSEWPTLWGPPPDLFEASERYFLPKSLDILFQQSLILALVLTLAQAGMGLRAITLACGAMFGGMHLLLLFGDLPVMGVIRFTLFASLFGLVMPWLLLRNPNALVIGYALHWSYYALTIVTLRVMGPGGPLIWILGG